MIASPVVNYIVDYVITGLNSHKLFIKLRKINEI